MFFWVNGRSDLREWSRWKVRIDRSYSLISVKLIVVKAIFNFITEEEMKIHWKGWCNYVFIYKT